jgi:UDP-3-O-acyl-N-acetylglucosamine deacetylase
MWKAGVYEFPETGVYLKVLRPIEVHHNDSWVKVKPLNTLEISMSIEFRPPVGKKSGLRMLKHSQQTHLTRKINYTENGLAKCSYCRYRSDEVSKSIASIKKELLTIKLD